MVSGTPLEKTPPIDAFSEIWKDRQPFLSEDQKVAANGRGKNTNIYEPVSGFVDQNGKLWTDLHPESIACRFPAGDKGTRDETSLFSSSLSDILKHKMRFSASNVPFHQSASSAGFQNGHLGPLNCVEETESQAIKNLLPDEEELLSGVTSLGQVTHAGNQDDFEDFDLFSSIGGIELEADERIWAGNRSGNFNKSMPNSQWGSTSAVGNHNEFLLQKTTRLLNGVGVEKGSTHNSSGVENTFHPSAFQASAGNQFSLCQPSHSPNFVNLESCYANSFSSHSLPDAHSHAANVIPWKSIDNMTDSVGECPRVAGEMSRDLYQADLAGKAASLNGRAYGYSANGSLPYQMDRYLSAKSDLYECHPSRSSVWPNSPSFLNGEHANYALQLPGYPKLPHSMVNVASPMHHLQVGSAPGVNAAFWDPVDSFEDLNVHPNSMQSVAMHFGSPGNSVEMSSHRAFSHAGGTCMGASNHAEILSQMSHSLNGRNSSISMPSSFGFPNERVRNRANSGNADKKNYELNIDRIMRGDDARTTLMIKNIPNKYTSKMLLATIDEQHKGKYDFIYLPIDFKNKCNVGYAFINMVDPKHIASFYQTFNGKRWEKFNSEKIATLAYARIQGKSALIAHFQNSSLMNEDKRCRPILFHTDGPNAGDQEPFPSSNSFRLRSGRAHTNFNGEMEGRGQGRCNGTKA